MTLEWILLVLAWVAIAALALVSSHLIAQVHILRIGAIPDGHAAAHSRRPPAEAPRELAAFRAEGRRLNVLFVESRCLTCRDLGPRYVDLASDETARRHADWVIVSSDDGAWLRPTPAVRLIANRADLFEEAQAVATPYGITISEAGLTLASPLGSATAMHSFFVGSDIGSERVG